MSGMSQEVAHCSHLPTFLTQKHLKNWVLFSQQKASASGDFDHRLPKTYKQIKKQTDRRTNKQTCKHHHHQPRIDTPGHCYLWLVSYKYSTSWQIAVRSSRHSRADCQRTWSALVQEHDDSVNSRNSRDATDSCCTRFRLYRSAANSHTARYDTQLSVGMPVSVGLY